MIASFCLFGCHSRRESAFCTQCHNTLEQPTKPKREHHYWVYILSNRPHTLYIGITNNLAAPIAQHRGQTPGTHTARYKINRLVYFEHYKYVNNAIAREKELKHWTRAQKIALIESTNPTWEELMTERQFVATTIRNADSLRE